ncbi:hypothetical protein FI667_g9810, partial [Globisporangium splendens]
MRRFFSLLALCVVLAFAAHVAADEGVREETVDANGDRLPPLTEDEFASIMMKVSNKCVAEVQANPKNPEAVSERCRAEVARKIQRFLARKNSAGSDEAKPKPKKAKKKAKKQTRAQREAAAARKKEEEYQETLQVIVGFVVTLIAVIGGAMFFINRKLKDAGMYYPTDPAVKADGCCG